MDWEDYEDFKDSLEEQNLTPEEYEEAISDYLSENESGEE